MSEARFINMPMSCKQGGAHKREPCSSTSAWEGETAAIPTNTNHREAAPWPVTWTGPEKMALVPKRLQLNGS